MLTTQQSSKKEFPVSAWDILICSFLIITWPDSLVEDHHFQSHFCWNSSSHSQSCRIRLFRSLGVLWVVLWHFSLHFIAVVSITTSSMTVECKYRNSANVRCVWFRENEDLHHAKLSLLTLAGFRVCTLDCCSPRNTWSILFSCLIWAKYWLCMLLFS